MSADRLPSGASVASDARWRLARDLVSRCPPALGCEVAITGSVGRGVADQDSDIELNVWGDALPSKAERVGWLRAAGATDIVADTEPIETGSIWVTCRFRQVWVEAGWQTIGSLEHHLRTILAGGSTTTHGWCWRRSSSTPFHSARAASSPRGNGRSRTTPKRCSNG